MFVPLFPFPVPIPPNRPALLCTARPPHRAIRERLSAARSAAPPSEDAADPVPTPPIPLGQKAGESKEVLPLVLEVRSSSNSKPGGPWRIFAYFLYVRK